MKRELTAPEAMDLYRREHAEGLAALLRLYRKMLSSPLAFLQIYDASALLESLRLWMPLVEFLIEHSEEAGASPAELAHLHDVREGMERMKRCAVTWAG